MARKYGDYDGDEDEINFKAQIRRLARCAQGYNGLLPEDEQYLREQEMIIAAKIEREAAKEGGYQENIDTSRFTNDNYPDSLFLTSSTKITEPSDTWDNN